MEVSGVIQDAALLDSSLMASSRRIVLGTDVFQVITPTNWAHPHRRELGGMVIGFAEPFLAVCFNGSLGNDH